jgi:hypothetical protein
MRPVRGRIPAPAPARAPALVQEVVRSPGAPLPAVVRTAWEGRNSLVGARHMVR